MSTNAVAPMQDFVERLKTSLRDDVARMIPEEVLAQMIQSVIREEFFTGKSVGGKHEAPSFHALIIDAMRPKLIEKAAEIATRIAPRVETEMTGMIEQGIAEFMRRQLNEMFLKAFHEIGNQWNFQNALANQIRNLASSGQLR